MRSRDFPQVRPFLEGDLERDLERDLFTRDLEGDLFFTRDLEGDLFVRDLEGDFFFVRDFVRDLEGERERDLLFFLEERRTDGAILSRGKITSQHVVTNNENGQRSFTYSAKKRCSFTETTNFDQNFHRSKKRPQSPNNHHCVDPAKHNPVDQDPIQG